MSDNKKTTNEDWKSMSMKEFLSKMPKETFRMKLGRIWAKIKRPFFKYSSTSISGYRGHVGHCSHTPSHHQQPSASTSFRESQHFDPEQAYIQRVQERAYFQMVDGKGDPQPCDCDHER